MYSTTVNNLLPQINLSMSLFISKTASLLYHYFSLFVLKAYYCSKIPCVRWGPSIQIHETKWDILIQTIMFLFPQTCSIYLGEQKNVPKKVRLCRVWNAHYGIRYINFRIVHLRYSNKTLTYTGG